MLETSLTVPESLHPAVRNEFQHLHLHPSTLIEPGTRHFRMINYREVLGPRFVRTFLQVERLSGSEFGSGVLKIFAEKIRNLQG